MTEFLTGRLQFEVKYTHILNFSNLYKEIFSPYLKMATGFKLFNQNSIQEYIQIYFEEEKFHIDCRWDRIILVSEGNLSKFKNSQSAYKILFEILEKLRKQATFGSINNYVALGVGVKVVENTGLTEIKNNFKEYYLSDKVDDFSLKSKDPDLAVIYEFTENGKDINFSIGPYDYDKDLNQRNLNPYSSNELEKLKDNYGYMIEFKLNHPTKEVKYSELTDFISLLENYYSKYEVYTNG